MASKDLHNSVKVVAGIDPIVGNNTTEGTGLTIDTLGYESCDMVFHFGVSGDTLSGSVKMQASLEDSPDNSTWTAVAAAGLQGSLSLIDAAAEDEVVQSVGYIGTQRYVRHLITFTGTHTNGCPISAVAVLGHARHQPV